MDKKNYKLQYPQLETYKEVLELSHLKRKTLIVNILLVLFMGLLGTFILTQDVPPSSIVPAIVMIGIILIINVLFSSFDFDQYNNLQVAMYITIVGVYAVVSIIIFKFETPSTFTLLFLAYSLTTIYQDYKAMVMGSIFLTVSGVLLVVQDPDIFLMAQEDTPQTVLILIFVVVFIALLTLSSYILIKRKTFFYNQLASIKESEIRNIDLMNKAGLIKTKESFNYSGYYESLENFSKALSEKIGVDNLFGQRIDILKDLKTKRPIDLVKKYKDFSVEELEELALMEFEANDKVSKLALKASQSKDITVSRKEIFSESQFKSFNHVEDDHYVKIISFAVFYTLLKIDKPYLKELDEDIIKDMFQNSEYFYRVEKDIMDIYLKNNDVFDTIVKDYLKGGW